VINHNERGLTFVHSVDVSERIQVYAIVVVVTKDMLGELPVVLRVWGFEVADEQVSHTVTYTGRRIHYSPEFPDGIPGPTVMAFFSSRERCALYVALIVPDNNW
jgi:hypothetical protein